MTTSALDEAIYQNTAGNSQGQPLGFDDTGFHTDAAAPPSDFSAVTGWGVAYQEAGASVSPNAASDSIQIENFKTYVHLTNGSWVEVQNQAQDGINGAHYVADFSGDANIPWNQQTLSDGSVSVDAPPSGYNDHFWPGVRGTYTAGTVDGVFVEADMKTSDPSANLVAQVGADWWRSSGAQYVDGFANNPGVGGNDWVKLTTQWQPLYYSSLTPQQLAADPPPGLTTTTTSGGTSSSGTSASGGTSSGGTTVTDPTGSTSSGSTTGSTSTGSSSSGSTATTDPTGTTSPGGTSASGGTTSSGSTTTTDPTGTSGSGTTTSPVAPTLTVADHSLSVSPGGKVDLGVSVPNAGDNVSVTISGLPKYETITDNLDHKTFSGSSVTLTAAEVNSGLSLSSSYKGHGHPTATLTVTATDATGTPVTSTPQTITVKDPPATTSSGSSTTSEAGTSSGQSYYHWWSDHHHAGATTGSGTPTTSSGNSSSQSQGGHCNIAQWFNDHPGFAQVATTLSEAGASNSSTAPGVTSATSSTPSAGARAYALLNQMMAGDFNGESHFAQAATALSSSSHQQANLLTRPLH